MNNPLIAARDAFAACLPEQRVVVNARDWGVIDTASGRPGDAGPVLLLLPGTLGRADIFWHQMADLAESGAESGAEVGAKVRILSVSYPGSGGVADWIGDLTALLDRLGIARVAVLGSSLGGYVAQALAAASPDRVSHLFAANTLASTDGIDQRPPYSLDLWREDIGVLRGGFAAAMQAWGQAHPEQGDLVAFLLAESASRIPDAEMRARLAALKEAPALPPDPRPADQTTIIDAGDDPLLPAPIRQGVRARFPRSAVFHFATGGHFPYILRPALYSGLLRARLGLGPLPRDWTDGVA